LDSLKIGLFSGVTLLTVLVSPSAINASLCSNGSGEAKRERVARMRRARSMPKMDDQEVRIDHLDII
jgi:hypothetical protein